MNDNAGVLATCPACHAQTTVRNSTRSLRCACGQASNFIQCRRCGAATQQLQAHYGTPVGCPKCSAVDGSPKSVSARIWAGAHVEAAEPSPGLASPPVGRMQPLLSATHSSRGALGLLPGRGMSPVMPWRARRSVLSQLGLERRAPRRLMVSLRRAVPTSITSTLRPR